MDALVKGLETRGFDVGLKEQFIEVQIHGESLRFGLSEDLETQKREQGRRQSGRILSFSSQSV